MYLFDHIDILHYSNLNPIKVINLNSNSTNIKFDLLIIGNKKLEKHVESYINDHNYIYKFDYYSVGNFTKEVTIYAVGFIAYTLTSL